VGELEQTRDALRALGGGEAMQLGVKAEILSNAQVTIQGKLLRHVPRLAVDAPSLSDTVETSNTGNTPIR